MTMRNSASQNSGRKSKNNTFSKINADEISEDLSLGLILDDRDDSLFGGNWSDEEENDAIAPASDITDNVPSTPLSHQSGVKKRRKNEVGCDIF